MCKRCIEFHSVPHCLFSVLVSGATNSQTRCKFLSYFYVCKMSQLLVFEIWSVWCRWMLAKMQVLGDVQGESMLPLREGRIVSSVLHPDPLDQSALGELLIKPDTFGSAILVHIRRLYPCAVTCVSNIWRPFQCCCWCAHALHHLAALIFHRASLRAFRFCHRTLRVSVSVPKRTGMITQASLRKAIKVVLLASPSDGMGWRQHPV